MTTPSTPLYTNIPDTNLMGWCLTPDNTSTPSTGIYCKFKEDFTVENVTRFLKKEGGFPNLVKIKPTEFDKLKGLSKDPNNQLLLEYYFDAALDLVHTVKNLNKPTMPLNASLNLHKPSDETFAKWKAARAKRLESVASPRTTNTPDSGDQKSGDKKAGDGDKKA